MRANYSEPPTHPNPYGVRIVKTVRFIGRSLTVLKNAHLLVFPWGLNGTIISLFIFNFCPIFQKSTKLKKMLLSKDLEFIMEAHNGLSAKIVEEAGTRFINRITWKLETVVLESKSALG